MKRLVVFSVLLVLLVFLIMGFIGCSTDTENPISSNPKINDIAKLTQDQQALLVNLPANLTKDEIIAKLVEVLPGQFVPAKQILVDNNSHLAPIDNGGEPPGAYLGTLWMNWGFAYMRVYNFHFGWAGPLQEPGGANHMNYDFYSTDRRFTDRDSGGRVTHLGNLHVSFLKTSPNCLYIYDSVYRNGSLKCLKSPFGWDTYNQISDAVRNFLSNLGVAFATFVAAATAAIAWLIYATKILKILPLL